MIITGAKWTPRVNLLVIVCPCGAEFHHRADRWIAHCPKCRGSGHLESLRMDYVRRNITR
jgi:hypothetical protein